MEAGSNIREPIAVVGSSCRFPGGASSPSKLWTLLKQPRDVLRDIPKERLGLGAFYHEDGEHHGSTNVIAKAYLLEEDPRLFDASFFNANPMEADAMDPQQRLLLECVYECVESAGYPIDRMQGSATSVYVGCMTNDYSNIQTRDLEIINRYHGTGATPSILSNRISYFFDFQGPSVTMDTACSSSLAALHFAVQSLRSGESSFSIVGGVNLIFDTAPYVSESKLHMLSPTSRSRMWDASADGYARGEGVSALMLKTLSQALKDGDHIECIVRETGMNSDGRTTGMTMPSGDAQATLIRQTYARAGLDLRSKSQRPQYFEAHGTGTMAGDPQEARGIYNAFFADASDDDVADEDDEKLFCGSIKTVIGHLEGCAGLAGLLKASLAVQHGIVPPNLLFEQLNPDIQPYYDRLQIPTEALPWPSTMSPRRASVNSFGFGGTNVHVIIEQYIPQPASAPEIIKPPSDDGDIFAGPLLLSACTGSSLAENVAQLAEMLDNKAHNVHLDDLAFLTQTRRTTFPHRKFFPGGSQEELVEALRATCSMPPSEVGMRAPTKLKWHDPGILGIFTGQGAQWAAMGRDMIHRCHAFRASLEICEAALQSLPDAPSWSMREELLKEQSNSRLHEAALSQPLCTAIQIALVDTLATAGILFRGVVGHSSGEIAATYAAGLLTKEDAMRVAYYRGVHARLAKGEQGQRGGMLAVGLGIDDAEAFCKSFEGRLSVAASNSPTSTTLSGDEEAIKSAKTSLDEKGTFARLLKVDTAYHSVHMLPCAEPYLRSLEACNIQVQPANNECIWISSVHGHAELLDDPEDLAVLAGQYWVDNMCQPVLFSEAVQCALWRAGPFDLAVDVGAHPALKGPVTQTITAALGVNSSVPYTATLQRGHNDVQSFSASLGSIWTSLGTWVDFNGWRKAYLGPDSPHEAKVLKGLPSYSWSHENIFWKEGRTSSRYRLAEKPPHELLGRRAADDSEYDMRWRNVLKVNELPWTRGHVFGKALLFPTTSYIALALEAAVEIVGLNRIKLIEVYDMVIPRALVLEDNNNGVEMVFAVRRRQAVSDGITVEADFTCSSSVNGGALETNCSGRLVIELLSPTTDNNEDAPLMPARCPSRSGTTYIDGEAYYQAILRTTGLDYTGLFRGMKQIRRTQGFSSAAASWPAEDVGNRYLAHPGVLDVALQAILATVVNPTRIPIRGSWLPSACSRLTFDPRASFVTADGKNVAIESDCFLTKNTARSVEGDIHVFGPSGQCILQTEGFRMDNWIGSSAEKDRPVFSRIEYSSDLFYAVSSGLPELIPDDAELRLIEAINRSCVYYLRSFFSTVSEAHIAEWSWDRQAFCKVARRLLQQTADGQHPVALKSWLNDSAALIEGYKQDPAFKNQPDMMAIHIAGEHLAKIMSGEERALELYIREGVWAPLYSHGRFQSQLNHTIAGLVRDFAHRYPRAHFLEVGGGSAGTTLGVLNKLEDALGQYTFTDISAGFFEKARERLAQTSAAAADRVVYKVLDLEADPMEQGFEAESQDVLIAINVLHATADIKKSIQNVRRLLKPGGWLFMMEVTSEYLEGTLLMGPLEGWWLGNREGAANQPGLKLQAWDQILRETGFTGVDMHQSDIPDSVQHAVSVIVSQASDLRVEMLREPLEFLDEIPVADQVLIIGGRSLALSKTIRTISTSVSRFAGRVQAVSSVDDIDPDIHLSRPTAVIALCELEKTFFADPVTETRLKRLQALFANATDMLWVTTGHLDVQDPSAAMMVGLCRTLVVELEHINLQFLNTTTKGTRPSDARLILEAFVRLRLGASEGFSKSPMLWSNEPELTVSAEDQVLIPRLKPDSERNDRLNSAERHITKTVTTIDKWGPQYTAVPHDGLVQIQEVAPWVTAAKRQRLLQSEYTMIQTALSVSLPHCTSAVLLIGYDQEQRQVLALTHAHTTNAPVRADSVIHLKTGIPGTTQQLRASADLVVAKHILAAIPPEASPQERRVIIHGVEATLASKVAQLAKGQKRIIFTESSASAESIIPNAIRLHPRSSDHILRRSLPSDISYVVAVGNRDGVAKKLLSMFPGDTLNLDGTVPKGEALPLAGLESLLMDIYASDQHNDHNTEMTGIEAIVPAHVLPHTPASSLSFPAVVDWSVDVEHSLQITVNPIHGHGMFSPDKSYLMVSLVSTLGRSICRWMVENGARHIALASRSANVDPQWLEEMAHLGANIRVYRMDVTDKKSVQSTVATIRAEMPPIVGVANAALVLRDRQFLDMELADMTEVLAPKVDGSFNLHEEFQDPELDFFILFSTLSCVIGNAGQSNYDAASLYQVMLAKQRRLKGLPASVMDLGCVADVGYVAERGQALFDKLARTMKLPLAEADMHQIFAEAVAASPVREGEVVDSTTAELVTGMGYYNYSPNTPSEAHPPWFNNQLTSHFVREDRASNTIASAADGDNMSVVAQLDAATSDGEAAAVLTRALASRIETMLQMASGSFNVGVSLLDVGIDSLLAVELRTWFLKQVHVDVPVLKILSGDSGEAVCIFAASQYLAEKSKVGTGTSSGAADAGTGVHQEVAGQDTSSSEDGLPSSTSGASDAGDSALATSVSTMEVKDKENNHEEQTHMPLSMQETGPMTRAQARMWVADQMTSNHAQNNNVLTYDLHGLVHVARLRRAVATVVSHHPGLHTCFFQDTTNAPRQGVLEASSDRFKHIPSSSDSIQTVERMREELSSRRWRLDRGEALETILISHTSDEHTLLIGFHHIAMDGSSWPVFFRDLDLAYQGVALQAPAKSLIDIAKQQATRSANASDTFWQVQFSSASEPLPLLDFASTKIRPNLDGCGNHKSLAEVDGTVVHRINGIARSLGVTLVNFYLAAVQCLVSRLTSVEQICLGVTDSGRDAETVDTPGFFINMLPLRLGRDHPRSFEGLVKEVNSAYGEARKHSDVPFDSILETLAIDRDPTCTPIFQVGFDLRPGQTFNIPLGNCQLRVRDLIDSTLPYDITFCVTPMPESGPSYVQIITRADLYSQEATALMTSMYVTLLESAVQASAADAIDELRIHPQAGVQRALDFGRPKHVDFAGWPSTLTERFERVFRQHPNMIAVKDNSGSSTYEQLSSAAMSLSFHLKTHQGSRIAVLCEPQRAWIISMLAVLRVGGTFVSLDATLPPARLTAMIKACECDVLLCHNKTEDLATEIVSETSVVQVLSIDETPILASGSTMENLEDPSRASLILCTSGTTGVPKAILLSSHGFLNYLAHQAHTHGMQAGEVILQQSSLGFDMAIAQALLALTHGATLVIAPQPLRGDPVAITELMVQEDVSLTFACPTEYLMWLRLGRENLSRLSKWRLAYSGGEKVPEALRREMRQVSCQPLHYDVYGPTEATICATMELDDELVEDPLAKSATSVGRPLANVGIFVLDSEGHICAPGIPGEVYIAGSGVALGYVDSSATSRSFVETSMIQGMAGTNIPAGRMYKTGDKAVWRVDGTLGFLGRIDGDTTIKIRGLRTDLTDVENTILCEASHLISDVIVTPWRHNDDVHLVAHVVLHDSGKTRQHCDENQTAQDHLNEASLEDFMQGLPSPQHMKPTRVVVHERLPMNANGKVNRRLLGGTPLPERSAMVHQVEDGGMTTLEQLELHIIWQRILDRADIPRSSNVDFWAMGGSSLDLARLQAAIATDMQVKLSIRDMFKHSTLGEMADLLSKRTAESFTRVAIDWDRETRLPADLKNALVAPNAADRTAVTSCDEVLLTGADTFLGGHILRAMLRNDHVRKVHCLAVASPSKLPAGLDAARIVIHEGSTLHLPNFGLDDEIVANITRSVDRIIIAGGHGHCLHSYASLRQSNVASLKFLAACAIRRRTPLHFISSGRVTLLAKDSEAALPPVSLRKHQPHSDGAEGLTAAKWVGEVFLERLFKEAAKSGLDLPITIHRPCALIGDEAPLEDALNSILRFSALMSTVPQISRLPISGYFDFAPIEAVAQDIANMTSDVEQPPYLRFRHHSGGVKIQPNDLKGHFEKMYGRDFAEIELEEWVANAQKLGMEPIIGVYLRAVFANGQEIKFPFMGEPSP
ncbi:Hybrid PKS-NRPS synthetase lepA [Fulvia fulva]|nr:Hybrid PKS-NRPS synthetase lepA [Fulvia fulva]KAK4625650.1 Hybrid PKS-NRPS synthetase lepA [Fulvia fulva]